MKSKTTGKRRPTIGNDPLEAYVPATRDSRSAEAESPRAAKANPKTGGGGKVRATFHVSADILEEARNAVVYLAGPPTRLTLADLAENALKRELERLKKAHNSGKEFPARNGDLRGGRPIR
ncbi:MAG: hypothetical protein HYV27_02885 [Candidatus Hydrogenedentes bacterium]|nr:hypothetical protein [Candidatus Hydrogenedentota bacterium]